MEIQNLIFSLRRSRFGAVLVAFQIALTLAIVSNAVFIAHRHLHRMQQPSGIDEANTFSLSNQWVGEQSDLPARRAQDLDILRTTPGVIDAFATNALPLAGASGTPEFWRIGRIPIASPDVTGRRLSGAAYRVDEHALRTLGLRLVAGRWFKPEEIISTTTERPASYPHLVVTRALAAELFPNDNAVGGTVYDGNDSPSTIIGVVDRLLVPWSGALDAPFENSILVPWQRAEFTVIYVVRTTPGRLESTMHEAERRLRAANAQRVISRLQPFTETRSQLYRRNRSVALNFASVCVLLLLVTGLGIIGLTSYWISQRRHHIGMRRALGARRGHIIAYYQAENFLIAGFGAVVGVGLATAVNLWLMKSFATPRMDWWYVIGSAVAVIVLGQIAAFWPALRAASIPPALATRAS